MNTFAVGDRVQVTSEVLFTHKQYALWRIGIVDNVLFGGESIAVKWIPGNTDEFGGAIFKPSQLRHSPIPQSGKLDA